MFRSHVNLAVLAFSQCEESAGAGPQGRLPPDVGSDTGVRLRAAFRTPNCRLYRRFTFPAEEDRLMQLREDDGQPGSYAPRDRLARSLSASWLLGSQPQSMGSSGTPDKFGTAIVDGERPLALRDPVANRMVVTFLGYQRFLE